MTWNLSLWGKAWSWRNLQSRLCLLKQSCINLETKWALFDSSFDIIKIMYTYIHILPLFDDEKHVIFSRQHQSLHDLHSPPVSNKFLILLDIIKVCMIYILPIFDDDNHYHVNSFWHHQNLHDSHSPKIYYLKWVTPLSPLDLSSLSLISLSLSLSL